PRAASLPCPDRCAGIISPGSGRRARSAPEHQHAFRTMIDTSSKGAVSGTPPWPGSTIAAGYRHSVALRPDGTVVAVGYDRYGQCRVEGWRDVVAVAAGSGHTGNAHTVGLRADGTVLAVGWNEHGQCEVGDWSEIVAIATGWRRTVGLRADG